MVALIIRIRRKDEVVLLLPRKVVVELGSDASLNEECRQANGKEADKEEGEGEFMGEFQVSGSMCQIIQGRICSQPQRQ